MKTPNRRSFSGANPQPRKGSFGRIALLSDQTLFRQGVRELLAQHGFTDVTEFATHQALLAAAKQAPPYIVLVDLDHENEDNLSIAKCLRQQMPGTPIVLVGADAAALLVTLFAQSRSHVSATLRTERRDGVDITPRQQAVLRCLATGADNQTIARQLCVGERAVKAHVTSLLEKFHLQNRTQLALLADHAGLRPTSTSVSCGRCLVLGSRGEEGR